MFYLNRNNLHHSVTLDKDKCKGCSLCVKSCPFDAITNSYADQYKEVEWIQVDEVIIAGESMPVYKLQGVK